jgi:hypothetical protein
MDQPVALPGGSGEIIATPPRLLLFAVAAYPQLFGSAIYCAGGAGGVRAGAGRAGALPAVCGGRAGAALAGGRRGGKGVAASAAPVVSWGAGCGAEDGSAVMMLTGGIDADDG